MFFSKLNVFFVENNACNCEKIAVNHVKESQAKYYSDLNLSYSLKDMLLLKRNNSKYFIED